MASIVSIKIKTDESLARVVKALGPAIVLPPYKRNIANAAEFRLMEVLGAVADALDPPAAGSAEFTIATDDDDNDTTPNPAAGALADAEKAEVAA